jgi:ABC-type sugar transport system permease subunit
MEAGGDDARAPHGLWWTLSWFLGLLVMTFIFGLVIALALFLVTFFRIRGGLGFVTSALYAAAGLAFILMLAGILGRDFPPGLLQSMFDLPWPFT